METSKHYILLIRHGRAEEREEFYLRSGEADELRPLTRDGIRRLQLGMAGLAGLTAIDTIVSSPLTRARQTADVVAEVFPDARRLEFVELAPGGGEEALSSRLVAEGATDGVTALVGHEPDMGELAGWLLTGRHNEPFLPLKKGSALLLELHSPQPGPASATLRWSLTPAQLRMLGGCRS